MRYHAYMYMPLPPQRLTPFMRFRLGTWTELGVHADILRNGSRSTRRARAIPIEHSCFCCRAPVLQDEMHIVFECSRFANLRTKYPRLFTEDVVAGKNLKALMQSKEIKSLVAFIAEAYAWMLHCRA